MMRGRRHVSKPGPADHPEEGQRAVWLISNSPDVGGRVARVLNRGAWNVRRLNPAQLDDPENVPLPSDPPPIVVLDIGRDLDRGRRLIISLRERRTQIQIVILATEFSREFALKILNEGVSYYFPYDFVEHEFESVMESLGTRPSASEPPGDTN